MLVELHNKLQNPARIQASRVLITYDDGTPLCLVLQQGPGWCKVCKATDDDFNEQLRLAGIDKTVIVSNLKTA